MKQHRIEFPGTAHAAVELPDTAYLADYLTAVNSPVLFGCRSGICGTCLIEVEVVTNNLLPPAELEAETLELHAPTNPKARLACQLSLTACITLKKISSL
jgi:ferredoxin